MKCCSDECARCQLSTFDKAIISDWFYKELLLLLLDLTGHRARTVAAARAPLNPAQPPKSPCRRLTPRPAGRIRSKIIIFRSNFGYLLILLLWEEISISITGFQTGDFFLSLVPAGSSSPQYQLRACLHLSKVAPTSAN